MLQQAATEGLRLVTSSVNKTGYRGVFASSSNARGSNSKAPKAFQAQIWREGRTHTLGTFTSAPEAALCYARHLRHMTYVSGPTQYSSRTAAMR